MGFDDLDKRRVLDATDIAGLIGEHVTLKSKGREFVCLCPFHDDRNPSMYVVPHKQMYHCFVCGAGGDAITFAMKYLSLSFPEALEMLAERAGIELEKKKPARRTETPGGYEVSNRELIEANELAQAFFRSILAHEQHGEAGRSMIERRGISAEMVEAFGIGASPDRWDGLILYAKQRGIAPQVLAAAGLTKVRGEGSASDYGSCYDALRNRLIFPIRDEAGRVIAFGGRRINDEDDPKYLNSPETGVFHKSQTLYGIDGASKAIRSTGRAVIVEGYTDVVACHQGGFTNVVGTLGTALTAEHARRLRGRAKEIVLLFDGDEAGQRAADRAFEVLFKAMIDVRVALLDKAQGAKDPDELLKSEGGPEKLQAVIDNAEHILDFWARRLKVTLAGAGPAAVASRTREEVARLHDLGLGSLPPVDRRVLLERLSVATGVSESALRATTPDRRRGPSPAFGEAQDTPRLDPRDLPAMWRSVLATAMLRPAMAVQQEERLLPMLEAAQFELTDLPEAQRLARAMYELLSEGEPPALREVMLRAQDDGLRAGAAALAGWFERNEGSSPLEQEGVLLDCLTRFEILRDSQDAEASIGGPGIDGHTDTGPRSIPKTNGEENPRIGVTAELASRLARVKRTHGDLGSNPVANPFGRRSPSRSRPLSPDHRVSPEGGSAEPQGPSDGPGAEE
ncbi:MAG: DNA primase [Planctomycetota bacterium]